MLIDNEKLVGLLMENSGLEQEKVEKQLAELVSDIKKALEENEAYEVEGFGIFSKLGNNIHFIPSEDLETEINYKYVGMEPIELPGSGDSSSEDSSDIEDAIEDEPTSEEEEENPIEGLLDESASKEYEDPFAEIFSELDEEESEEETEEDTTEPEEELEEDDIDFSALEGDGTAEDEEELDDDPFGGLEENTDESIEDMDTTDESLEEEPETEEIAPSGEFLDDSVFDTEAETEEEEEAPGPDKWGIDAHKEEDTENAFAGLLGANAAEEDSEDSDESDEEEDLDFSELDDTSSDDFDDPFDEFDEETQEEEQDDTLDDFVPVVTNVSSGKKAKSNKKEAAKEEEKVEADEEAGKLESKTPKSPRDRKQGSPVFLYMILALVVLGGAGYGLAYFGIINIQGITPASNTTQQPAVAQNNVQQTPPPPVENPPATQQPTAAEQEVSQPVEEPAATTTSEDVTNQPEENTFTPENRVVDTENEAPVEAPATNEAVEVNADTYGLMGSVTDAGNNGYTIVLYTLSRQDGAETQYQRLTDLGYRTMIIERPSDTYGVLYRVAIGQFASLADAAIAAEKLDADFLGNYLIAKI